MNYGKLPQFIQTSTGFKPGLASQCEAFGELPLAVNWGHGAPISPLGETGQTCSRHGAKLEELRSSLVAQEEEEGPDTMWPWPHYKWQHMAAPWGTASSGPSLHPLIRQCMLLVSKGKYLAKK